MTDTPEPLDPDQVTCRKCLANPGEVCHQPNGDKARTIHAVRRRDAVDGTPPPVSAVKSQSRMRTKPKGSHAFDKAKASAAGKKSAQERRRRRAEAEAAIEAKREEAQRRAVEEEAEKLAADAVRFQRDRAILKRQTLDAASKAYDALLESLTALERCEVDDDGKVRTEPREHWTRDGNRQIRESPVVKGWATPDRIERLAKVAASTLQSLRLEEGKATGINENRGTPSTADQLGEVGVEELLKYAAENLPGEGASS